MVLCLIHFVLYIALCPFQFYNYLNGEEKAGCVALFVFLVSCDGSVALPHGAVGWSAVCDCGISDHNNLVFDNVCYKAFIYNMYM